LIRRLDAEWRVLAGSRLIRDRIQTWAADDEQSMFEDGDHLVAAAQRQDAASWADRDKVLTALLQRATNDAIARRVALQVVLPGVKSLINGVRGWEVEERAARVVATELDVISWCATEPTGTPPSFRIYTNTRRRVLRSAVRARSEPDLTPPENASRSSPSAAPYIRDRSNRPTRERKRRCNPTGQSSPTTDSVTGTSRP
jgi:hypothetical protein